MRQGIDEVSNTFFFLLQIIASPHGGRLNDDLLPLKFFFIFFFLLFLHFHVDPPSLSGTPVRSSLSCWLKDIWFLPQISDLWLLFLRHVVRLGNSLNKTEHLKAPLAATLEALLLLTSNRTKVVWTERLTFRSAEPPVLPVEGLKIKKYLIYFMAGHWGENIKEPNDKKRVRKKKDLYQSLSMDTIIESCLILMVLLLLTCARHLIVDCTALKSPIYLVTISSRGH